MANICSNDVIFYGNPNKIKKIYNDFTKLEGQGLKVLASKLGIDEDLVDWRDYIYMTTQISKSQVCVDVSTAWSPRMEFFDEVAQKYDIDVAIMSEESGSEIYWIYGDDEGKIFKNSICLEVSDENQYNIDDEYYWFISESELAEFLNKKCQLSHTYEEWTNIIDEADGMWLHIYDRDSNL